MEIKTVYAVYFSATGRTRKVVTTLANAIAQTLELPLETVDFTLPAAREETYAFTDKDLVIFGTPTYAGDLASAIHSVINHDRWVPGIYHFTDEGVASWYDFTKAIFEIAGKDRVTVKPINTAAYPTPAKRPHYSVLSKNKIKNTFGIEIPYWRDSLAKCLKSLL